MHAGFRRRTHGSGDGASRPGEYGLQKFVPILGISALTICSPSGAQTLPQRRVDVGVTLVNTYQSNILRLPDGVPALPGNSKDDLRFNPALTVDLELPLGRNSVFLNGLVGYDFYKENDQLERERIRLTGGTNLNFTSCGATLQATYARQQSDLDDIFLAQRRVNTENRWLYDAYFRCRTFGGLTPSLNLTREKVTNSDPNRQEGNYTSDTAAIYLGYERPVLGEIRLGFSYNESRYDERQPLPGLQALDRIEVITADVGFTREIGSQLTGSASIGYTRVNPSLPGVEPYSGLSYSGDLSFTPGTRIRANVGFAREAKQSNLLSISYAIVDTYSGQVQYALGERITLTTGASYQHRSLRDSPLTAGPVLVTEDSNTRLFAGANYMVNRRLSFSLDGSAERRRADVDAFEYDNYTVALTTRLTI